MKRSRTEKVFKEILTVYFLTAKINKQTNTQTHQSPTELLCSYSKIIPNLYGKVRELE